MKHYVYVHKYKSGPKEGEIFYVGKGVAQRMYVTSNRNKHWTNIYRKYGRIAEKVAVFDTNDEAVLFEINLIKDIGLENLANKSPGGESGLLGSRLSSSHKRKISIGVKKSLWKRKDRPHPCLGRVLSENSRKKLSESLKKRWGEMSFEERRIRGRMISKGLSRKETYELMSELNSGCKNPKFDHKEYVFLHKDGRVFHGTQFDFYRSQGLKQGNISLLVNGKRKSAYGWRIEK